MIDIRKLQRYYKLKNMVRYNNMTRSTDESVAEHSYYVVLFTHMICNYIGASVEVTNDALSYAISHDLPEIYLSDVPHTVKVRNPELNELLFDLELEALEDHMPEYVDCFKGGSNGNNELVLLIVQLADIVSVIQYSNSQLKLGNQYFEDVFQSGFDRYEECKAKLCEMVGMEIDLFDYKGGLSKNEYTI